MLLTCAGSETWDVGRANRHWSEHAAPTTSASAAGIVPDGVRQEEAVSCGDWMPMSREALSWPTCELPGLWRWFAGRQAQVGIHCLPGPCFSMQ